LTDILTPYGVILTALDGDKELADKCVAALFEYVSDVLEYGNNQEPVIRPLDGCSWAIIDLWDNDWSVM